VRCDSADRIHDALAISGLVHAQKGLKMTTLQDVEVKLNGLIETMTKLDREVTEIKSKVDDKGSTKTSDKDSESDLADLLALLPLCGVMPLTFGTSLLFPFGLRIGAARALALGRALERAAKISGRLTSGRDGRTADLVEPFVKAISTLNANERRAMAEVLAKVVAAGRS
jgi:hypothetical protein